MTHRDEATGRFLPGNRFWETRSSAGPKPKFTDPEKLWDACVEYFEWCEDNPLHEAKAFSYEGAVTIEALPKMRAMTIAGLCLFLDVSDRQWREWRESRPDLLPIITRAEAIIYEQKFTGAAADLLNPNIIARDLGLKETSKVEGAGPNGEHLHNVNAVNLTNLSDEELEQLERLTDKARNSERVGEA